MKVRSASVPFLSDSKDTCQPRQRIAEEYEVVTF